MKNAQYEIHRIVNPLLPFIFHGLYDNTYAGRCPPNWHENIEILVCHHGRGYMVLDGRQYLFTPGDICIANSYCLHATTQEDGLGYSVLIISKDFLLENGIPLSDISFQEHIHSDDVMAEFMQVVYAYRAYRPDDPCCIPDIRYAVLGLLRLLCRKYSITNSPSPLNTSREWIKQAIAYINLHYAESFQLQDIADQIGISKYYLSRTFRKYTGTTIVDMLNHTRCTEAKRLIEGGTSVSEAAFRCGYENLSYFTRAFRKYLGQNPSHFRKDTVEEASP